MEIFLTMFDLSDPIFYIVILIHATQLLAHDIVHYTDSCFTVTAYDQVQLKTWNTDEPL